MITLWSQPACVQCAATKRWLNDNGVEYVERQIQEDLEKLEEFRELGIMRAPVVESDMLDPFSGFRPDLLLEIKNGAA